MDYDYYEVFEAEKVRRVYVAAAAPFWMTSELFRREHRT